MDLPHDNEWLKIVASTCLGLIAGLVAEPLKNGLTNFRTRREIANAIMSDLRFIRAVLPVLRLNNHDAKKASRMVELPAYEHYWESNKGSFYTSVHLRLLRFHCENILSDIRKMQNGWCGKLVALSSIEEAVTEGLKTREPNLFMKVYYNWNRWQRGRSQMPTLRKTIFLDDDGKPIAEGDGGYEEPIPRKSPFKDI